jgi:NTE family protein
MKKHILTLIILLTSVTIAVAQNTDTIPKPKIGLVLSGGGAKGLAHIGVLKVLEQAGIKPDYITGTSMGSIIGGLYALGYSADEISEINRNADWAQLLSDDIPLNKIVMEQKHDSKRFLFRMPFRKNGLSLPSGFIEGQELERLFRKLAWPLPMQSSFDSLPIPFRCMSVDLVSGETIEHSSGDFVTSIRSSMSIPSIFSPVDVDTLLLVDGGVSSNFPVEQVRRMGADIVIGVYVGFDEDVTKEDLFALTDVLTRSTGLGGIVDSKKQIKNVDYLIVPDLKGLTSADFVKGVQIEQYGEEAAQQHFKELKNLADSLNLEYREVKKIEQPELILVKNIQVNNLKNITTEFFMGQSRLEKGQYMTNADIEAAIDRVYGTNYFNKITYTLFDNNDDSYTLIFNVKEKSRVFYNLSLRYDSDLKLGVANDITFRNYLIPSSEVSIKLNIAQNPAFKFELKKYWGKKQRFMNFYFADINNDELTFFQNGNDMGKYDMFILKAGAGMKYSLGLNRQVGILGKYEYKKLKPHENLKQLFSDAEFNYFSSSGFGYTAYYNANTTDDLYFPKRGLKLDLTYTHMFNPTVRYDAKDLSALGQNIVLSEKHSYSILLVNYDVYMTFFRKATLNLGTGLGLNSDNTSMYNFFGIGGSYLNKRDNFIPFAGLNFGESIVRNFSMFRASVDVEILSDVYLNAKFNVAQGVDDAADIFKGLFDFGSEKYFAGYGAGLKYDSPIGPVQLMAAGNTEDKKARWYFSIGFPF